VLDPAVTATLLVLSIGTILLPRAGPAWSLVPPALAALAIALGTVPTATASEAARSLGAPLAFVLLAVPLAVLLDELGFFRELAGLLTGGRHYRAWLWVVAAAVTAGLNLDAAVVLLTPLYIQVAARRGTSAFALALQPALLSGLASSALPISNLTNLIAAARLHLGAAGFVEHLGVPTVVASAIGYVAYSRSYGALAAAGPPLAAAGPPLAAAGPPPAGTGPPPAGTGPPPAGTGPPAGEAATAEPATGENATAEHAPAPSRPANETLLLGGALVAAVVAGFLLVPLAGGQPWEVAAGADVLLMALTRRLPWRAVPWPVVVAVLGLGVLASATAMHLPVHRLIGGASLGALARTTAVGSAASGVVNNLPALLVALPGLASGPSWPAWALLLGTNVGALLVPSGSLAVLLWLSTVTRLGVPATQRHWLPVALRVALPGLVTSLAALLLMRLAA
jgi:arsenical pump membrane protein